MKTIQMPIQSSFECDVLVCGGGVAGTCAAIAAARAGVRTILIEEAGGLGGQATLGLVSPTSSVAARDGRSFGGLMREILQKTHQLSRLYAGSDTDSYSSSHILRLVLMELAIQAGVALHLHTKIMAVERNGDTLTEVLALTKSGVCGYKAKRWIDATGDADVIALAGEAYALGSEPGVFGQLQEAGLDKLHFEQTDYAPYAHSGALQPVSYMFTMGNVDGGAGKHLINKRLTYRDLGITREDFKKLSYAGINGFEENGDLLPLPQGRVLFFPGVRHGEYTVNMSRVIGINGADAASLNLGEQLAQMQILPLVDVLKRLIPGFAQSYLVDCAVTLGVRESRRLIGRYVLTGREALNCTPMPDVIAHCFYLIDIHDPFGKDKAIGGEIRGDYFDIPYGALVARQAPNLLACGRCISADHVAHSATRIQGSCMLTGQAAGTAAALSLETGRSVADVDVLALQSRLIADSVFLDIRA